MDITFTDTYNNKLYISADSTVRSGGGAVYLDGMGAEWAFDPADARELGLRLIELALRAAREK